MTFIANHWWTVPLLANLLWLAACYWLINVMTGGLAIQFVGFLLFMGTGIIWALYGAFHFLIFMLEKWN